MIKINDEIYIAEIDKDDLSKYKTKELGFSPITNGDYILAIDFKNDVRYSIRVLKRLNRMRKMTFGEKYKCGSIKYAIKNFTPEVISAFKAMYIKDYTEKATFLFDELCKFLDDIWSKNNPCDFCDSICGASRNDKIEKYRQDKNGCCGYAFDYSKKIKFLFKPLVFKPCKYLEDGKGCTTANLSCKIFVCGYVKNKKNFYINPKDLILMQVFFNKKQKYIIRYHYFIARETQIGELIKAK